MAIQKCAECKLPLTDEEAAGRRCPVCKIDFARSPQLEAPGEYVGSRRPIVLLCVAGVVIVALVALVLWREIGRGRALLELHDEIVEKSGAEEEARAAAVSVEAAGLLAAHKLLATEKAAEEARLKWKIAEERTAVLEKERKAGADRLQTAESRAGAAEKLLAEERERHRQIAKLANVQPGPLPPALADRLKQPDIVHVIHINRPAGIYQLKALNAGTVVHLVGTVKKLQIDQINDRSVLDASGLRAEVVVFLGAVNSSTVKVNAPGGVVVFRAVNAASKIDVNAPEGKVMFLGAVNGNSTLALVAKEAEFKEAVTGESTRVLATLTKGGRIRFTELTGGTRMHWRIAENDDQPPRIEAGRVRAKAEFRRVN